MAKIIIPFDNVNYPIDETSLSAHTTELQSHLSTVMGGSGAVVKLGETSYNVDSTKLSSATNALVTHLGTIAGTGRKVVVSGVEYSIDSAKVGGAITELHTVLGGLETDNGDAPSEELLEGDGQEFHKLAPAALTFRSTAPLNELQEVQIDGVTVDPSNYTLEEGSTIVTLPIEYLKTLDVDNYEITVVSDSKSAKGGFSVVQSELNEHGFYYNQPYTAHLVYSYTTMVGGLTPSTTYVDADTFFIISNDGTANYGQIQNSNASNVSTVVDEAIVTYLDGVYTVTMGKLVVKGSFTSDGKVFECIEASYSSRAIDYENFSLRDTVTSDGEFLYLYIEFYNGNSVHPIDKDKSSYKEIRNNVNDIPTTNIGDMAFKNSSLANITIPDSVVAIGNGAFADCKNLTSVIFGENSQLDKIGYQAFVGCNNLSDVVIPSNVSTIDGHIFGGCGLESITFNGTMEQWKNVDKSIYWHGSASEVICSDGTISLNQYGYDIA